MLFDDDEGKPHPTTGRSWGWMENGAKEFRDCVLGDFPPFSFEKIVVCVCVWSWRKIFLNPSKNKFHAIFLANSSSSSHTTLLLMVGCVGLLIVRTFWWLIFFVSCIFISQKRGAIRKKKIVKHIFPFLFCYNFHTFLKWVLLVVLLRLSLFFFLQKWELSANHCHFVWSSPVRRSAWGWLLGLFLRAKEMCVCLMFSVRWNVG